MQYNLSNKYSDQVYDLNTCSDKIRSEIMLDFIDNLACFLDETYHVPATTATSVAYSLLYRMGDCKLHYHTPWHILSIFDFYQKHDKKKPKLSNSDHLAIWFHDAIYIPGCKENEKLSMNFMRSMLEPFIQEMELMEASMTILSTARFLEDSVPSQYAVVMDLDLWTLGVEGLAEEATQAIAQEFTEEEWKIGRPKFLQAMSKRQSIFRTDYFKDKYEITAQSLLRSSLI